MEGDLQQRLGRNLKAWREKRGVSQEALAHELGYHRTYLRAVERGLRPVKNLADQLGLPALSRHTRVACSSCSSTHG